MRRVFIGIKASQRFQAAVVEWKQYHTHVPVRWIPSEDLHITLVPPWDVLYVEEAMERMKSAIAGVNSFDVTFNGICYGPKQDNPWLIWATIAPSVHLRDLHAQLNQEFGEEEARSFKPHVTLARFDAGMILAPLQEDVHWTEKVSNITLFETHGGGAGYNILEKLALAPSLAH